MKKIIIFIVVCFLLFPAHAQDNQLAPKEIKQGWVLLFDGKTFNGWRVAGDSIMQPTAGWSIEDHLLKAEWRNGGENKNIITKGEYANFEFSVEWKLAAAANSGIIYHHGDRFTRAPACTGPEYQIIDDLGWPEPLLDSQLTGVNYGLHWELKNKNLKPVGEWNESKIVFKNGYVEHWLNGKKILQFHMWTPDWYERLAKSGWRGCFSENRSGAFILQIYPNCKLWFKNIKVRPLGN